MEIKVVQLSDGWEVWVNGRLYHWNHNEEDLGTNAIRCLLEDLGFVVKYEEDY